MKNDAFETPLFCSIQKGFTQLSLALIKKGASPNIFNQKGVAPLCLALSLEQVEVVNLLLERLDFQLAINRRKEVAIGLIAFFKKHYHFDVLHYLKTSPDISSKTPQEESILRIARQHIAFNTTLLKAASLNDMHTLKALLQEKFSMVNAHDLHGNTALHYAALHGHLSAVQLLIEVGQASVNTLSKTGHTPLHKAAIGGHSEIVDFLIRYGASIEAQEYQRGWTPLHEAVDNGHVKLVKHLVLEKKANVMKQDQKDQTAAMIAKKSGLTALSFWLDFHGAPHRRSEMPKRYLPQAQEQRVTVDFLSFFKNKKEDGKTVMSPLPRIDYKK